MTDGVVAVGKDCDCGNPLIWRNDEQYCAVYGTHPPDGETLHFRDHAAAASALIEACMAAPNMATRTVRRRNARKAA